MASELPSQPDISVVVGAYNAASALATTLGSVLGQQGAALELIVVDDGSTDQTSELLAETARSDDRIKILRQDNGGLTSALIRGCHEARGKYIARQDIGDRSLAGRLRSQMEILEKSPDVVMVTCGCRFVGPRNEILSETLPKYTAGEWTQILRRGDEIRLHGPHHGSVMFRKAAYDAVGGYRPEFFFSQDLDLWTRLAAVGMLECVQKVLYQVGFTYDSISARFGTQQRQLRHLIALATQRRLRGEPDADLLRQAAVIGKPANRGRLSPDSKVDADYFIGSCLAARRDPVARDYLRRVLRHRPFHGKAWAKLLWSYTAGGSAYR